MKLEYQDHTKDPGAWARRLGISREAVELYLASEIVDLHIDSFIWQRILRYDLTRRHGRGPFGARFFSQVDFPRIREAGVSGGLWSITTNPLPTAQRRARAFAKNLDWIRAVFAACPGDFAVVRDLAEYRAARREGKHAALISIQGGNALDRDDSALDLAGDWVVRITLVHLSSSSLGVTSAPSVGKGDGSLTDAGRDYVRRMNDRRILVDLAHISRKGFFDAVEVHDKSQPLIVTHTGVTGVHRHWRNLDDEQVKAIARSGGTIGVIYQSSFLGGGLLGCPSGLVVDHLEHIIRVAGEDFASLGSDWDGMIVPPTDMPTCLELPRLVQHMLDRRWSPERVQKVLGDNFLRTLGQIRPGKGL